jgi:hypothetical protein
VTLEGILPTVGEVAIGAKDHARLTLQVTAKPGEVTDLGQVTLEPGLEVRGLVTDPEGKPTSASFQLLRFDRTAGKFLDDERGYGSGADGQFTLHALGRELYLLRSANASAFNDQDAEAAKLVCAPISLDLRRGTAPESLRIQLVTAGRLTLVLRGELNEFMRFRVSDGQGNEVFADRFWWLSPYPLSLAPGAYGVELLTPERALLATKSVTLGGTPMTVELAR